MKAEDAEEFTQSLGQIAVGTWRQIALGTRLGVPKALGLDTREWVEDRLGGYVRLSLAERREAVAELTTGGMGTEDVSDVLGVHPATIRRDRADARREDDKPSAGAAPETPKRASARARIAALPDDLAARVRKGLDLDEAEGIAVERQQRIDAYVARVREALDVIARMAGYPIPAELSTALTEDERGLLDAVLAAIPEGRTDEQHDRFAVA